MLPGTLAFFGILYTPLVWVTIATLTLLRFATRPHKFAIDKWLSVTLGLTVIVCWPPLVRPLLDGDSLLYHLPNAVAFVQSHSIWSAYPPYWMYPPASELFAAGILAASGQWSLPLAGIMPALLITARLYTVARRAHSPAWVAAAIALAFICMPVAAFEAGTLQNDLWLAAFFVEVLTADRSVASAGLCALLKPFGWIEASIAAFTARLQWRVIAFSYAPLALWLLHDYVLVRNGAAFRVSTPPYFSSTIAGNLPLALSQLGHGIATVTPQSFVWLLLLAAGLFFEETRRYAFAGIASLLLYAFLPLAYSSGPTNYVRDASSFRFALPALAAGALIAAVMAQRAFALCGIIAAVVSIWGAWTVLGVFWNDTYTHWAIAAACVAVIAAFAGQRTRGGSVALAVLAILTTARWGASSRALGFYGDWMRDPSGKPTGVFTWISTHKPRSLVADNVRIGAIYMLSPGTRVVAGLPGRGCDEAARRNALFLIGSNENTSNDYFARARNEARECGQVLYEDSAAIVIKPPPPARRG